jgi:hypothetical protein
MSVAFFVSTLAVLTSSAQEHLPLNLYFLIPGNWTFVSGRTSTHHVISPVESTAFPNATNVTTYEGDYQGSPFRISAFSNTTGYFKFGAIAFDFEFVHERELVAQAECHLSDGTHLAVTAFSDAAVDISVISPGSKGIRALGLAKMRTTGQSWKETAFTMLLALVVTLIIRRFWPSRLFGH